MASTDRTSEILLARARSRRLAAAVAVLCGAMLIGHAVRVAHGSELAPVVAPDFALKSTAGPNIRLSEYRSDVVALAFVASWCGSCRDGLPGLRRLQDALGAEGLRVVAVSFDERPGAAADLAAAGGGSFPVLLDPDGEAGRLYDVGELPMVVLVDRAGHMRGQHRGGRMVSEAELTREIRALLDE